MNITNKDIEEVQKLLEPKDYQKYLKSSYWKKLSKEVKDEADNKCRVCNSRLMLCVHHRSYFNKGDYEKEIKDLVCLCDTCHSLFHGKTKKIINVKSKKYRKKFKKKEKSGYMIKKKKFKGIKMKKNEVIGGKTADEWAKLCKVKIIG